MSFSVHNADLHMTNANTVEDKRITPPSPVIVIRAMKGERCVCARVCVEACADTCTRDAFFFLLLFFARTSILCAFEGRNKESIWSEPVSVPV